jgi:ubiquinone/menaquinone biosynthesis C-methylase UbiE
MTLKQRLVRQAGRPRGIPGQLVGWLFAHRGSNVRRNRWAVSLLDVQPTDRVLEIGFGPGIAIAELARLAGQVYGVDHSDVMVRQARRRNRARHVHLVHASVDQLPDFGAPLDAVLAVNTIGFWAEPVERLRQVRQLLRPGGRIALVSQPRSPGATRETTDRAARELSEMLSQAGFSEPRTEILDLDPPVACVLASTPTRTGRSAPGAAP